MEWTIWVADGTQGLFTLDAQGVRQISCALLWPHAPCPGGHSFFCACKKRGVVQRFSPSGDSWAAEAEFSAPPGLECMQSSPDGGKLYLLSGEADSLLTVSATTGEMLYGNAAGVYPRSVQVDATGTLCAVAGGAAGEILLYQTPSLKLVRSITVPGIACQAVFCSNGLAILCAIENGEVDTVLGFVGPSRKTMEEVYRLPGLPGALAALPDGTLLVGSVGSLARISLHPKKAVWRSSSFGLPSTLSVLGNEVLVSDPLLGRVIQMNWQRPREQHILLKGGEMAAVWQGI